MTSLAEIQRGFAHAIDASSVDDLPICNQLQAGGGLSAQDRLGIYRNNSRGARRESLEETFKVCRTIVGERCFAGLAAAYVASHPSLDGDLNRFGDAFAGFMAAQLAAQAALSKLPYLADLARLEWYWHTAYYATDDRPFDAQGFAATAAGDGVERIRFRLSNALRLLRSPYPVLEIWRRHRDGGDTARVAAGQGDYLVISRSDLRPAVEPIDPASFHLLSELSAGRTLGEMAAAGQPIEDLPDLIGLGWIVGFSVAVRG